MVAAAAAAAVVTAVLLQSEELEALVEQLPAAEAAALRLTLLQGMSLRQAGEALGVSVMTAQRRKERAVKAIREALQA